MCAPEHTSISMKYQISNSKTNRSAGLTSSVYSCLAEYQDIEKARAAYQVEFQKARRNQTSCRAASAEKTHQDIMEYPSKIAHLIGI